MSPQLREICIRIKQLNYTDLRYLTDTLSMKRFSAKKAGSVYLTRTLLEALIDAVDEMMEKDCSK